MLPLNYLIITYALHLVSLSSHNYHSISHQYIFYFLLPDGIQAISSISCQLLRPPPDQSPGDVQALQPAIACVSVNQNGFHRDRISFARTAGIRRTRGLDLRGRLAGRLQGSTRQAGSSRENMKLVLKSLTILRGTYLICPASNGLMAYSQSCTSLSPRVCSK